MTIYICECDNEHCQTPIPTEIYDALSEWESEEPNSIELSIRHVNHDEGLQVEKQKGDFVVVRDSQIERD